MLRPCFAEGKISLAAGIWLRRSCEAAAALSLLRALHRTQAEAKRCDCCATALQPPHTFIASNVFLDASSQRVCLSVGRSVGQSVRPYVMLL